MHDLDDFSIKSCPPDLDDTKINKDGSDQFFAGLSAAIFKAQNVKITCGNNLIKIDLNKVIAR